MPKPNFKIEVHNLQFKIILVTLFYYLFHASIKEIDCENNLDKISHCLAPWNFVPFIHLEYKHCRKNIEDLSNRRDKQS
jgi:hypothetical protein